MPPTQNPQPEKEKLLTGIESEKLLPKLSAKEFLLRTPTHELNSVFGAATEARPVPKAPAFVPPPPPKAEDLPDPFASLVEPKPKHRSSFRFFLSILLLALIALVGLYIYGWYLAR